MSIRRFSQADVTTWYQSQERGIYLSDVLDETNSGAMSVGFARYAPGESNEWVVTYDEALIVTKGTYTVTGEDGRRTTARAGELIFLTAGTPVVYSAEDDGAEVVYVTHPHWMRAQQQSEHAALLDTFHPAESAKLLLQRIWGPLERGESDDFGPFFGALADDVVFTLPVGELRGPQAVIDYFVSASETLEFRPFERPIEYFGDGDRVVMVGDETFTVKDTGAVHRSEWAWVVDVRDGRITRIAAIQDLSGIEGLIREAVPA